MLPALMLPALPFTILMPALSLLLVFRTNTGYARWNEVSDLRCHSTYTTTYWNEALRRGACNSIRIPGCDLMHPGAHALGWSHQQLPQCCAPKQHESDTFLPCFPYTPAPCLPDRAPCPMPHPPLCQVRQCNTFFPDDAKHEGLKRR